MIYRVRAAKKRYEITAGTHYMGFHFGRRSLYLPIDKRLSRFKIKAKPGRTEIATVYNYKTLTVID